MNPIVLIVDDSDTNLYMLTMLLGESDVQILPATSGRTAVKLAAQHPPALVLLDLQMPEIDGFETAALLRALPQMQGVPIVAVTANASESIRERVARAGFAGYFSKPIDPDSFPAAIRHYLDRL